MKAANEKNIEIYSRTTFHFCFLYDIIRAENEMNNPAASSGVLDSLSLCYTEVAKGVSPPQGCGAYPWNKLLIRLKTKINKNEFVLKDVQSNKK